MAHETSHYSHFLLIEQHAVDLLDGHVRRLLGLKVHKPIALRHSIFVQNHLHKDERVRVCMVYARVPTFVEGWFNCGLKQVKILQCKLPESFLNMCMVLGTLQCEFDWAITRFHLEVPLNRVTSPSSNAVFCAEVWPSSGHKLSGKRSYPPHPSKLVTSVVKKSTKNIAIH